MWSHSLSLLFFMVDTAVVVLSVARFELYVISTDTRVAEVYVDWTLNLRIANKFEDVHF